MAVVTGKAGDTELTKLAVAPGELLQLERKRIQAEEQASLFVGF